MIEFLTNYWSEILSVAAIVVALIPPIVHTIVVVSRKIHFVLLDHIVLEKATSRTGNISKQGTILIVALNLSIFDKSFFAKKIYGKIKFNKKKYKENLYEGSLTSIENNKRFKLLFDKSLNLNANRAIQKEEDNLRVAAFFFENIDFNKFEMLNYLEITFKGKILQKKIKIMPKDCVYMDYLSQFKSFVSE